MRADSKRSSLDGGGDLGIVVSEGCGAALAVGTCLGGQAERVSHTWSSTIFSAAAVGTASSMPHNPSSVPPTRSDRRTVTGLSRAVRLSQ